MKHNLRIVFSGTNGDIGDCPIIPRYFKKVITDWVKRNYYESMNARNPRYGYGGLMMNAENDLYNARTGSWWLASNRASKMSPKERGDLQMYLNRGNW